MRISSPFSIVRAHPDAITRRIEASAKAVALGFVAGPNSYLQNNWNVLDFVVVVTAWVYILFFEDDGGIGSDTGRGMKPNVFRCVRALRPLRTLQFFQGLKAVLAALGASWHLLVEVVGFLFFFFCIFSAVGISLFKGGLTYRCEDQFLVERMGYSKPAVDEVVQNSTLISNYLDGLESVGVQYHSCPDHVAAKCMLCGALEPFDTFVSNGRENPLADDAILGRLVERKQFENRCCRVISSATSAWQGVPQAFSSNPLAPDLRYDDRKDDVDYYGFDWVGVAVLSEFVATTMDEWPALSHPLTNSDSENRIYVWFYFALMTLTLAVLTANLFVSVICYAFGQLQLESTNTAAAKAAVAQLRAMFNRFDADGSGQIGAAETASIAESLGIKLKDGELDAAMDIMDADHQGDVDFEEFSKWWGSEDPLALRMKRALATEEHRLKVAFNKVDTDGGGTLDAGEVRQMAKVLGIKLTDDEQAQMMTELDENGDNEVDFGEFTSWWFAGSSIAQKVKEVAGGEENKIRKFYDQCVDIATGEINFNTMENFGSNLGLKFTKPELLQAMEEMDDDQGGTVDYEEFSHWWKSGSKIAAQVRDKLQEQEGQVRVLFGRLDDDNSGQIDRGDMKTIGDSIGLDMTDDRLDVMMAEMDDDGSGEVDMDEFLVWWTSDSKVAAELNVKLQPFLKREAAPKFPYVKGLSEPCRKAVDLPCFEWTILVLVLINACFMATDSYPMDPDWHRFLVMVEIAFCVIYSLEALMKIFGLGAGPYFQSGFNRLDFSIVVASIVGLIVPKFEGMAALRGLRVLVKMLRVMRVFKLLSKYDTVMMLLKTVMGAWKMLVNLVVFIVFVLALFAVAGMHTVGMCHLDTAPENVFAQKVANGTAFVDLRENYFDMSSAIVTTFQVMSGEDWAPIMYKYMHCAGWPSMAFFILLFAVSNFMMLNLFVAVILMNFEIAEEEKLIKQERNYIRDQENSKKTDAEKNAALMWLRNRRDKSDPKKLEAMQQIRSGIRKAHGEAPDDDGSDWNKAVMNKGYEGEDNALYCLTPGNPLRKLFVSVCDPGGTLRTDLQSETQSQWAQRAKAAGATEQEIEECEDADDTFSAFYRLLKPTDWFDYATLTVIVMSSVALALDRPHNASTQLEGAGSDLEDPLVVFNLFVTLFFLVEFVIKVIAYGFCFAPRGYIMDPWNVMDFVVLLISIFDAIMTLQEKGTNEWTRILRLLRILRPLRMIKHAEGMKVIVNALIACGPMVLAVMVLNAMFYVIFATLGVGLFKGQFFSCDIEVLDWGSVGGQLPTPGPNDEICTSSEDCVAAGSSVVGFYTEIVRYDPSVEQGYGSFAPKRYRLVTNELDLNEQDCATVGGTWSNPPYNFDNIFQAFKSLFIVSTLEGWIDIMHAGMDVNGPGNAPLRDNQFYNFLFFWFFVILGAYFVTNIFVGVMVNFFSESSGSGLLTHAQKQWQMKQLMCLNVKSRVTQVPEPGIRLRMYTVATSPMCECFIQFCIIVNTGVMVAEHFPEDASLSEAFCNANLAFLVIFTLEAAVKIFALGMAEYLQDNWYRLDIVIVTSSWLFMFLAGGTCASGALRSLRVLRIVLLLKSAPNLKNLFQTLILSLPPCLNLSTLMLIIFFMWGIFGVQFFGELPTGDIGYRQSKCLETQEDGMFFGGWPDPTKNTWAGKTTWADWEGSGLSAGDLRACNWTNSCGRLGPPECWHPNSWGGMLNKNDNFDDIFNSFKLLFQISTGQDWMNLCKEVKLRLDDVEPAAESTHDMLTFFYFMSFYVASVFVFLNLFVAVLLENFEMNFESELLDLNPAHVEQFKRIWTDVTEHPKHDCIHISKIRSLVEKIRDNPMSPRSPSIVRSPSADGSRSPGSPRSSRREPSPFAQILDDENWFNRLIFELGAKPKDVHADVKVGFHELLLALTLLQHSYEGLAYKDAKKKEMEMERRAQEYAAHVITAFVRCRRVCREAAVGWTDSLGRTYDTPGRVETFQKAAWCARTMLVDSAVRTNKIAKASEVLILGA